MTTQRTSRRMLAALAAGTLVLAACGSDSNEAEETPTEEAAEVGTIVEVAAGNPDFSTLVAAVEAAGLVDTLSGEGPFTVFAPTNEAFDALPEGLVEALLLPENVDALTAVLTYHVVPAEVPSSAVESGPVTMVQGEDAEIVADGDTLTIAGANIIATDVAASNGVIHVIDAVIVPPSIDQTALLAIAATLDAMDDEAMEEDDAMDDEEAAELGNIVEVAAGNPDFSTLVAAVEAAGLVETLSSEGPFTVFAPTNDAFAALPEGLVDALLLPENLESLQAILTYHVIAAEVPSSDVASGPVTMVQGEDAEIVADGDTLTINQANIVATDVAASNGVIHVIDAVIVPPSIDPAALLGGGDEEAAADEPGTIIEVAEEAGIFNTLLAAGEAAGINAVLEAPGAFTIFAPTDEAFEALPEGLVEALLLPENSQALTTILTYHALPVEVFSADVAAGTIAMFSGEEAEITVDGETIMINEATVIEADVDASNGVIHVIDAVIVPPSIDPAALLG